MDWFGHDNQTTANNDLVIFMYAVSWRAVTHVERSVIHRHVPVTQGHARSKWRSGVRVVIVGPRGDAVMSLQRALNVMTHVKNRNSCGLKYVIHDNVNPFYLWISVIIWYLLLLSYICHNSSVHTQHIWWQKLCCCWATYLEETPSTLVRWRHFIWQFLAWTENVLILMLLPGWMSNHVLHPLLPPPSTASQHYNMRERTHSLQLPEHSAHLSDCNFITHMLYKNTY